MYEGSPHLAWYQVLLILPPHLQSGGQFNFKAKIIPLLSPPFGTLKAMLR